MNGAARQSGGDGGGGVGSASPRSGKAAERKRWKARCKERHLARVEAVLDSLRSSLPEEVYSPLADGILMRGDTWEALASEAAWDEVWSSRVPEAADPAFGGRLCGAPVRRGGTQRGRDVTTRDDTAGVVNPRAARKRWQVATIALVLRRLLGGWGTQPLIDGPIPVVVDFGCGSGNLLLPLAALFPGAVFVGIDMKAHAIKLLRERVAASGLTNVRAEQGMIEQFGEPFDVAVALHACGNATDYALLAAAQRQAAYVACPCCVGKLKFSAAGGSSFSLTRTTWQGLGTADQLERSRQLAAALSHPRSAWLRSALASGAAPPEEAFADLAQAADFSHESHHARPELAAAAKRVVELDRIAAAAEAGYRTALARLLHHEDDAKTDLLVGVPADSVPDRFGWGWLG
eukprot:jgi/Tetstr1/442779/TSEL_030864.t1